MISLFNKNHLKDNGLELSLDHILSISILDAVVTANMGAGVFATSNEHAQACEDDVEVNMRVVLVADVDVRIDANAWEAKRTNELNKYTENKPAHSPKALLIFIYIPN